VGVTSRARKIIYVTTALRIGGAEAMLARLAGARPAVADEVVVVSLLPAEAHADRLRAAGVTVVDLDFSTSAGIAAGLARLARLIAAIRPDIVQGWMYHGDLAALVALLASGRRRSTRLVWSIRCSDMDLRRYGTALRLVVKACTMLSGYPDVVTANSDAGLKFHLEIGYRPRRTEVVANGIDIDRLKPDPAARAAVRNEFGIASGAVVLAHVARVDPMKDHQSFLAAMTELPHLQAMLIGAGSEDLQPGSNLMCLGHRDDVPRLLAASDVVVSSSAFGEGFSNAIAEGMACGLPAVATAIGDAHLVVGDNGLIVPPSNPTALAAALRLLTNEPPAAHTERGMRARARIVEHFSMDRAVARYTELYASILASAEDFRSRSRSDGDAH
jgi:glycosyltransferase involved in cell wall biosynthesis